jgi:hypothetical protein
MKFERAMDSELMLPGLIWNGVMSSAATDHCYARIIHAETEGALRENNREQ